MRTGGLASLVFGAVVLATGGAGAAPAECRALIERREQECQDIAEKRSNACPAGVTGSTPAQAAECSKLSEQLKALCTSKPCGPPAKKARAKKSKAKKTAAKRGKAK